MNFRYNIVKVNQEGHCQYNNLGHQQTGVHDLYREAGIRSNKIIPESNALPLNNR